MCLKYIKPKPQSVIGLSLAQSFNETIAVTLNEWCHSERIWLLDMIDHATRSSVSCVINSKKKEIIK